MTALAALLKIFFYSDCLYKIGARQVSVDLLFIAPNAVILEFFAHPDIPHTTLYNALDIDSTILQRRVLYIVRPRDNPFDM